MMFRLIAVSGKEQPLMSGFVQREREVMPLRAIVLPPGRFLSVVTVATLAQRAIVNEVLDGLMGTLSAPNSKNGTGILSKRNRSVLVYPLAPIWVDPWPFFFHPRGCRRHQDRRRVWRR